LMRNNKQKKNIKEKSLRIKKEKRKILEKKRVQEGKCLLFFFFLV
jgi:hypothetical protein